MTIVMLLMVLGAIAVAVGGAAFKVSPWRIFGAACALAVVTLVLAARETNEPCGGTGTVAALDWIFVGATAVSLTLFAAAALAGVVDGVRLGRAGERGVAISRGVGCPLTCMIAFAIVFVVFLSAVLHCLE